MTDKEQIKCKYKFQDKEKFDGKTYCTCFCELCEDLPLCDDNCQIYEDFKQLVRKTQECESSKQENFKKFFIKKGDIIETILTKDLMDFIWNLPNSKIKYGAFTLTAGWDYANSKNCIYISDDEFYTKVHEGDKLILNKTKIINSNDFKWEIKLSKLKQTGN